MKAIKHSAKSIAKSMGRVLNVPIVILAAIVLIATAAGFTNTTPVKQVKLDKTQLSLLVDKTYNLKATILPANATNRNVIYTSGNNSVASVSKTGVIKALKAGKTTITATSAANRKLSAKLSLTVTEPSTRTITDMAGRKVVIPYNVNRVCSSGTAQNQLMLFLGAGKKIVATLPAFKANPWVQKVLPDIKAVPAPFEGKGVNIEELIKAKPDVVTLWSGTEEIQKKLDELKIPYVLIFYSTTDEFKKGISLMGEVLGKSESEKAQQFIRYYDGNIKTVSGRTSGIQADKRKRVYYMTDTPLSTEGSDSIVTSWINIAGGVNIAAKNGIKDLAATVSIESVIEWDPEVIIIRDAKNKELIMKDELWKNITAVKNRQVYVNPKGVNVWSARSADGALQPLWAGKILNPGLFKDIDLESETKKFYKTYYNYSVTAQELKDILYPEK
ncbi:kappa-carrageenase precursor [Ruminiclostridium hungatei]|uniref:Kappa-carrageenase n=1 Tax=Ruminiclostridium hungatei TaxID=48256 RepID=A0A1V4SFG1_RUMHU|nr:ABC transporter substrate-binding protein [Ruminiclostridium hungatei]OPX42007.1 kappa-carrageenase precursor [Ruminiclostridium hungatei]